MIPARFDYVRADSVEGASKLLVEHGEEAKLLAGGHSLLPLMKLRLANPSVLVDIRQLPELGGIEESGDGLRIGAGVRHRELERSPLVQRLAPLLSRAAATVGDPQVRSRGTIGGSLAHADPAADLPATLLALDAVVVVTGPAGSREVSAADFFVDFWETALAPDEILLEVRVPSTEGLPCDFQKFRRRSQDWAIVGVAAVGGDAPRIGLVNMAAVPCRATAVEQALRDGASHHEAAQLAAEGTAPTSDLAAEADYRRHLSRVLVERSLTAMAAG